MEICLTFFEKNDDSYIRHDESFIENAYSIEILDEILNTCGFEVLEHYDYLTKNEATELSEKITFVSRKVR